MKYCGIDVGTRSSSICVIGADHKIVKQWSGRTNLIAEELEKLGEPVKCVIEASPMAEHICLKVEAIGGEIEIVDSRHTKALLQGKKKTDRVDARVLAGLSLNGWYRPIHRKSGKSRERRTILAGRAALVGVSTKLKNTIRGLLKSHGIVLASECNGTVFLNAVLGAIRALAPEVQEIFKLLLQSWKTAYEAQEAEYKKLQKLAKKAPEVKRLLSVPGVGAATALAFVATIDSPQRFKSAKQVVSYLGLAPRVHQSGGTEYHGRITKQGDKLLRWLLIESAGVLLTRVKAPHPLKDWGLRLEERKGKAKAKVAVARRLAVLLLALWRKECEYSNPVHTAPEALPIAA